MLTLFFKYNIIVFFLKTAFCFIKIKKLILQITCTVSFASENILDQQKFNIVLNMHIIDKMYIILELLSDYSSANKETLR